MTDVEQEISDDDKLSLKTISESLKTVEKHIFPKKIKKSKLTNGMRVRHTICYFVTVDGKKVTSSDQWTGVYIDGEIIHFGREYSSMRGFITAHHKQRKIYRCQCLPIEVEWEGLWIPYSDFFLK